MILVALFAVATVGAAYPIFLYPGLVWLLSRVRPRPWSEGPVRGDVAHIVTVHNEEKRLRPKIENCLALRCPPGCRLETLVASDGSTDGGEAIVREFENRGVRWLGFSRRGKEAAQLDAVQATSAALLVFSDAAATIEPDALAFLLAPFHDPAVLAVSGTDVVEAAGGGTGEGMYVRFEMALRRAESLAGSLAGVSGCFFAVRRDVALRFRADAASDMSSALIAVGLGGRAVAADRARCVYTATPSIQSEFRRKRRTACRGLRCLFLHRGVLGWSRPVESWQILSHKWWRFTIPLWLAAAVALGTLALISAIEWSSTTVVAGVTALSVLAAAVSWPRMRRSLPARALVFFVVSSAAVAAAWKDFLVGRRETRWVPTVRP